MPEEAVGNRERVLEIVAEALGVNKEALFSDPSLLKEVGADSLDIVALVMELEEEFEVTIPDDEAERIKTVADVIRSIEQHRRK